MTESGLKTLWTSNKKPKTRPGIHVTHDELPGCVARVLTDMIKPHLAKEPAREPIDHRPDSAKDTPKKRKYTMRPRIQGHTHRGICGKKCYDAIPHSKKKRGPGRPRKDEQPSDVV